MNLALGTAGVVLGLVGAVVGAGVGVGALANRTYGSLRHMRLCAWLCLGGAVLAVVAMERALITRDYTVQYVADVGSSRTPALFNFAALWSSLEGSILLWGLILTGYVAAVAHKFRNRLRDPLVGWALVTLFVVVAFFFGLMLTGARPFVANTPPPGFDGPGPNPLLQNHILMAFHPPMLYLGYVGFTVPFSFAVAALATGRVGEGWLVETRRWTLFAWGFLTAGIVLGAWWSYEVLGWGGYWAWDPVENASFLPWLTGTAYIHSVMVQERRGMLRVWNLTLLCATFALTILGTFLTRSGVVESVHAFSNSSIGPALLAFFGVVVAVTVGLIGWRGDRLRSPGRVDSPLSREGALLANNVLFAAFAAVVLLGTVWPLIVEALQGDRITVGPPWFNTMTGPIGFVLLMLMAVAPVLPWRKASTELLRQRLFWPAWVGVAAVVLAVAVGARGIQPLAAFGLGGFAAGAAGRQLVLASRRLGWRGLVGRANGGMVVHLGVVVVAVAFAASTSYLRQAEFTLERGESAELAGHTITYATTVQDELPERSVTRSVFEVDGRVFEPEISEFSFGGQRIATPSVRVGPFEDIYLALVDTPAADDITGPVTVRVVVQPLIQWLWVGGAIMVVGTALAAFPGSRRRPTDPTSAPLTARGHGGGTARRTGDGDADPDPGVGAEPGPAADGDPTADGTRQPAGTSS